MRCLFQKIYADQPPTFDTLVQDLAQPEHTLPKKHLSLWTSLRSELMALCLQWGEFTAEGLTLIKLHPPSKLSVFATMETLLASSPGHGQACVQMSRVLQGIGRLVEACDGKELATVMGELSLQVI